jgi:hypothetical protein
MQGSRILEIGFAGGPGGSRGWADPTAGLAAVAFGSAAPSHADVFFARLSRLSEETSGKARGPYPPRVQHAARVLEIVHKELWNLNGQGAEIRHTMGAGILILEEDMAFFLQVGPAVLHHLGRDGGRCVAAPSAAGPLLGAQAKSGIRVQTPPLVAGDRLVLLSGEGLGKSDAELLVHLVGEGGDIQRASEAVLAQLGGDRNGGTVVTVRLPRPGGVAAAEPKVTRRMGPEITHEPTPSLMSSPEATRNFDFQNDVLAELSTFMQDLQRSPGSTTSDPQGTAESMALHERFEAELGRAAAAMGETPVFEEHIPRAGTEPIASSTAGPSAPPPAASRSDDESASPADASPRQDGSDEGRGADAPDFDLAGALETALAAGEAKVGSGTRPSPIIDSRTSAHPTRSATGESLAGASAQPGADAAPPAHPSTPAHAASGGASQAASDAGVRAAEDGDGVDPGPRGDHDLASGETDFADGHDAFVGLGDGDSSVESIDPAIPDGVAPVPVGASPSTDPRNHRTRRGGSSWILAVVALVVIALPVAHFGFSLEVPGVSPILSRLTGTAAGPASDPAPDRSSRPDDAAPPPPAAATSSPSGGEVGRLGAMAPGDSLAGSSEATGGTSPSATEATSSSAKGATSPSTTEAGDPASSAAPAAPAATGEVAPAPAAPPGEAEAAKPAHDASSIGGADGATAPDGVQVPPGKALLVIQSRHFAGDGFDEAEGDSIWVDRTFMGQTPLEASLAAGVHSVRVTTRDGRTQTRIVDVPGDAARVVRVDFGDEARLSLRPTSYLEVEAGQPVMMSVLVDEAGFSRAEQLTCYYRVNAKGAFQARRMSRAQDGFPYWVASLPGSETASGSLEYYFEARDADGVEIVSEIFDADFERTTDGGRSAPTKTG